MTTRNKYLLLSVATTIIGSKISSSNVNAFAFVSPPPPDNQKYHCNRLSKHLHMLPPFSNERINGEESSSSSSSSSSSTTATEVTETIRKESLEQYSTLMDHFMFELGNDMVFLQNQQEVSKYIDENFDSILFDCDGVLYRGSDAIPDAALSVKSLLARQKQVLFVTNNAGSNRMQLRDKLATILNCEELREDQMVCSSYSAAKYIEKVLLCQQRQGVTSMDAVNIHVIGSHGLCEELRKTGAKVTGGPSSTTSLGEASSASMSREELATYSFQMEEQGPLGKGVDAIVVGLDTEFNYRKLCIANVLLQRYPDALFVATNEDAYDLVGADARHLPGNGALVKALEFCSQRKAINVGKPSVILAHLLKEEYGLNPERTLMVGDRLDTDIKFGKDCGMKSALVLTGCTTAEKLIEMGGVVGSQEEEPLPHIIFPHMGMMGLPW
jgi:phosphoglycolate/pyridoxal phosphate phosphatase family enzyme